MPSTQLHPSIRKPWPLTPWSASFSPHHLMAIGAALTTATVLAVAWPLASPGAVPMEPLLATPVTGPQRDWTLDFLRQSDTQHRLGRDGRIWVPQDSAATLRRQTLALGLAPAGTEAQRHNATAHVATRPRWGELKPE